MIKLENITLLDQKEGSEPINFTNDSNITYIDYQNKALFNLLSIRQQYIKDGSMMIDDFSLFPLKDQKKYAFVLNINSQVISLNAVFVLELSFKDKTRSLLKKDLVTLRDLPLLSDEQRKDKISKVFEVLNKFNCKYVLVNLNDQVNKENKELIDDVVNTHSELTYFFLNEKPFLVEPVKEEINLDGKPSKEEKVEEISQINKESNIADSEQVKDVEDFEKEFSNFDVDQAYEKASSKKDGGEGLNKDKAPNKCLVFVKEMVKHLYLYYLFTGLFSIFLSICSFSSVYLIEHKNGLIAGILLFLMIVFIFMHMYIIGSTYAGLRKRLKEKKHKIAFVLFYILFTVVGLGIGLGFIALLSMNDVFVNISAYKGTDWILGIIISIFAIATPCFCSLLGKLYVKIHILFDKLFPNNKKNDKE